MEKLTDKMIETLVLAAEHADLTAPGSGPSVAALIRRGLLVELWDYSRGCAGPAVEAVIPTPAGLAALAYYAQTPRGSVRARRALWNYYRQRLVWWLA